MKILVLTAIFGGKDTPKPFPKQSIDCDYKCITEQNTPVPLPNLPDRLKAKYFKLQAHEVFPEYNYFIWIDGNIEVTSADFVKEITKKLYPDSGRIVIQGHHERQTIKQEIDFIINSENPYLTTRYKEQPLKQEYEYYLSKGMPPTAPLFACNIFAYYCETTLDLDFSTLFMDGWWSLVLKWSWFDQSAFSYLSWRINGMPGTIKTVNFGPMLDNPYFKLHSHAQPFG
jgi:hypothetical protein